MNVLAFLDVIFKEKLAFRNWKISEWQKRKFRVLHSLQNFEFLNPRCTKSVQYGSDSLGQANRVTFF